MTLDSLIGEAAVSFAVGFYSGYSSDKRHSPRVELSAYLNQLQSRNSNGVVYLIDDKVNDIYKKKAQSSLRKMKMVPDIISSASVAILDEIVYKRISPDVNPFLVLGVGGLSFFIGLYAGGYASRLKRSKATLTKEEKQEFENRISKIDYKPGATPEQQKIDRDNVGTYITWLVQQKGNVEIVRPLLLRAQEQMFIKNIVGRFIRDIKGE